MYAMQHFGAIQSKLCDNQLQCKILCILSQKCRYSLCGIIDWHVVAVQIPVVIQVQDREVLVCDVIKHNNCGKEEIHHNNYTKLLRRD